MDKKSLKQKLDKIRKEQEFFREIKLSEQPGPSGGKINLINHELEINYGPEFELKVIDKDTKEYLKKKNIPKERALETLVCDLLHHEIAHRGSRKYPGCPRDAKTLSEKFLDPIYKVTKMENKQQLAYFANVLTDIIADTTIKRLDGEEGVSDYAGFYLFLKEQGKLAEGSKFSKLYESFARLSLHFNGDQHDKKLLEPYLTYDKEVNAAIGNFLNKTGISQMKTAAYQGSKEISVRDRPAIRKYLMDENNWEQLSTAFAEEFAKFMEVPPKEQLFGSGGSFAISGGSGSGSGSDAGGGDQSQQQDGEQEGQQKNEGSGSGDKQESGQGQMQEQKGKGAEENKKDKEQPDKNPGEGQDLLDLIRKELANQFGSGDGFGVELNQKETLRKIIRGRKAGLGPGWMTNFEYLVGYYEMLASDKLFELKTPPQERKTYPLIDLGERAFDFEDDAPRDIRGLFFDRDTKSLELYVAKFLYEIEAKVKKGRSDTPDIVFGLLDTSSSMLKKMPKGSGLGEVVNAKSSGSYWNVNSKYHVSLIAYFMMVERFSELGIYESDAYFANFSYETVFSRGLMNSKIEALCPQFGGTQINLEKIERHLSKKGTLIFTISDGEIDNYGELLQKFVSISEYNPCFHVQIGSHSHFSRGLQNAGVHVKQVNQEKDLYDFVIDLTELVYGSGSRERKRLLPFWNHKNA